MGESDRPEDRNALLAFVERHWRELTLREARLLCVEIADPTPPPLPIINSALTYR